MKLCNSKNTKSQQLFRKSESRFFWCANLKVLICVVSLDLLITTKILQPQTTFFSNNQAIGKQIQNLFNKISNNLNQKKNQKGKHGHDLEIISAQ